MLFDIDYTLFDVDLFRKKLYDDLASTLGMDRVKIEKLGTVAYGDLRRALGYFNPVLFLKVLRKKLDTNISEKVINSVIWEEKKFYACLYPETLEVVTKVAKGATIGIFSKGYDAFQRAKLLKIAHFFEEQHIHINVSKKAMLQDVLDKYKDVQLYLIDDALEVLYGAKMKNKDIVTIWVKRGRYAVNQEPIAGFAPDVTVDNLRGIVRIISNN